MPSRELISTPLRLERLDDNQAAFVGSAEENATISGLFGSGEVTYKFPFLALSREVWENLGCPTRVFLNLTEL